MSHLADLDRLFAHIKRDKGRLDIVFANASSYITGTELFVDGGIYLVQIASGQRTRLDLTSAGGRGADQSMSPAISGDGRFVAFVSRADLMCTKAQACVTEPSDTNDVADIYLRDTLTDITRRITRSYAGGDLDGPSYDPAISSDGRHVAFVSEAQNLTRASRSRAAHIYVHDLVTGITELVSRTPSGRPANGASLRPAISHDGGTVAFQSLGVQSYLRRQVPRGGVRPQPSMGCVRVWAVHTPHDSSEP